MSSPVSSLAFILAYYLRPAPGVGPRECVAADRGRTCSRADHRRLPGSLVRLLPARRWQSHLIRRAIRLGRAARCHRIRVRTLRGGRALRRTAIRVHGVLSDPRVLLPVLWRKAVATATSVFTLVVTVGALWEVFERVVGAVRGLSDTIGDLDAGTMGALAAASAASALR